MDVYTFDDGSTISMDGSGTSAATAAPPGALIGDYGAFYGPSYNTTGVNDAASWNRVLQQSFQYGFGRWIDNNIAPRGTAAIPPQQAVRVNSQPATVGGVPPLLLLGAAVAAFALLR